MRRFGAAVVLIFLTYLPIAAQVFPLPSAAKRRPDPGPMPKNIHGVVLDSSSKPISGAKVFIKDLKAQTVQTRTTDAAGNYQIMALPPTIDYEVYAEYKDKKSDSRTVSGYVDRQDNVLNFQLDVSTESSGEEVRGPEFSTFDLVQLRASLDFPAGAVAPIPTVLLLHGFGEDRSVWNPLKKQLLDHGWAVMALDLRGHGQSTVQDGSPIHAAASWRSDPNQFPQDIAPALEFIKAQPRLNNRKIAVIGSDVGADLALIASGRYREVRSVVAVNPKFSESLALAGSAQDFSPRTALIITTDEPDANQFKAVLKQPFNIVSLETHGKTADWIGKKAVADAILDWLQKTF